MVRFFALALMLCIAAPALLAYNLKGSVVDLEGQPVGNMEMRISWCDFNRRHLLEDLIDARVGENGKFDIELKFPEPEPGEWHFEREEFKGDISLVAWNETYYVETFIDPRYDPDRDSETYNVHLVAVSRKDYAVKLVHENGEPIVDEEVMYVTSATFDGSSSRQYMFRRSETDSEGTLRYTYMDSDHVLALYAERDDAWWNTSDEIAAWRLRGRTSNPESEPGDGVKLLDVGGSYDKPIPDDYSGRVFTFVTPLETIVQTVAAFNEEGRCVFSDRVGDHSGNYGRVISWLSKEPGMSWDERKDKEGLNKRYTRVPLPPSATSVLLTREGHRPSPRGGSYTTTDGYAVVDLPKNGAEAIDIEFKDLDELPSARVRLAGIEQEPLAEKYSASFEILYRGTEIDLYWAESDVEGWFDIPIFPGVESVGVQTWGGTASSQFGSEDTPKLMGLKAGKEYTLLYHPTVKMKLRVVDANGDPLMGFWTCFRAQGKDAAEDAEPAVNPGTQVAEADVRVGAKCYFYYLNQRVEFQAPTESGGEVVVRIGKANAKED